MRWNYKMIKQIIIGRQRFESKQQQFYGLYKQCWHYNRPTANWIQQFINMLQNPQGKLERLMSELLMDQKYKLAVQEGVHKYKIGQFRLEQMQPNQILDTYYEISNKYYAQQIQYQSHAWHENQLKIFVWILVCLSFIRKRCIQQFDTEDWMLLTQIFKNKKVDTLEYQALSISKKQLKPQKWCADEIQLLTEVIRKNQKHKKDKKWTKIGKDLFIISNRKYLRTPKQCRQCWINHVNPVPLKTGWTLQEDLHLIQCAEAYKKKWCLISKQFQGKRTEHMVKNRFKSLYRNQLKNYTENQIREIKQIQIISKLKQKLNKLIGQFISNNQAREQKNPIDIYFQDYVSLPFLENNDSIFVHKQQANHFYQEHFNLFQTDNFDQNLKKETKLNNKITTTECEQQVQKTTPNLLINQQNRKFGVMTMESIAESQSPKLQDEEQFSFINQYQ